MCVLSPRMGAKGRSQAASAPGTPAPLSPLLSPGGATETPGLSAASVAPTGLPEAERGEVDRPGADAPWLRPTAPTGLSRLPSRGCFRRHLSPRMGAKGRSQAASAPGVEAMTTPSRSSPGEPPKEAAEPAIILLNPRDGIRRIRSRDASRTRRTLPGTSWCDGGPLASGRSGKPRVIARSSR